MGSGHFDFEGSIYGLDEYQGNKYMFIDVQGSIVRIDMSSVLGAGRSPGILINDQQAIFFEKALSNKSGMRQPESFGGPIHNAHHIMLFGDEEINGTNYKIWVDNNFGIAFALTEFQNNIATAIIGGSLGDMNIHREPVSFHQSTIINEQEVSYNVEVFKVFSILHPAIEHENH